LERLLRNLARFIQKIYEVRRSPAQELYRGAVVVDKGVGALQKS